MKTNADSIPFVIDPENPDVDVRTPRDYMRKRLKKNKAKWGEAFVHLLNKSQVVNFRYYLLDSKAKCRIFYDILTHNVYFVYNN